MRSQLMDMEPVDDFVTQNTPGLKIYQEVWGDMQCAYHKFAPGTDFTALLATTPRASVWSSAPRLRHQRQLSVIYADGSEDCARPGTCATGQPRTTSSLRKARRSSSSPARRPGRPGCCRRGADGQDGAGPGRGVALAPVTRLRPNKSGRHGGQVADGGRRSVPGHDPAV